MLMKAAAVAATLGFVGSALGQMTLLADERYTETSIWTGTLGTELEENGRNSALIGQPFWSIIGNFQGAFAGAGAVAQAIAIQDSSVTPDVITAELSADGFGTSVGPDEPIIALARSRLNIVFSLAAPTPYDFAVTSWSEGVDGGEATARLEWADGSGVIENLIGVSSASGVLYPGEYRLFLDTSMRATAPFPLPTDVEFAALIATFSVPATPSACSEADVTTQGAGSGDPLFGIPDGIITAADINYYVGLWFAGCP